MSIQPPFTDITPGASQRSNSLTDIIQDSESKLVVDFIEGMRTAVSERDLYTLGVKTVYRVLGCDRVVVYSLKKASHSEIIAEAVNPQFSPTLGSIIKDSCFDNGYVNKYRQGRIRAINNIYEAGLDLCHIEHLEKIEVKADLIVPICDPKGLLYGLLVAHQCSRFRNWKRTEIDFTLQIANWLAEQLSATRQRQHLQVKLKQFSQGQDSLTAFTKEIHQQKELAGVLQLAVDRAKELLDCDRVIIYCLQQPDLGKIVAEAKIEMLASILDSIIKDPCFEFRYIDRYQQGRVRAISNIYEAGMSSCYIENLEKIAVKSNLVVPINWDNGKIYGILVAHQCFRFREWQADEIDCFQQMGMQTGLCLSKVELAEQVNKLQTNSTALEIARDAVTISKTQLEQLKSPIKDAARNIIEMNNLNKLLKREIDIIEQTSSSEAKKHTRLTGILVKKLSTSFAELKKAYVSLHDRSDDLQKLLENAATDIYKHLDAE